MAPSNRSIALGILILLYLAPTAVAADEEIANADQLARLASSQQALQAKFDARIRSRVDNLIEDKVGRGLAARTTQLLRAQTRVEARRSNTQPAALRAVTDDLPPNRGQLRSNTTCKMVGDTLACVYQDVRSH